MSSGGIVPDLTPFEVRQTELAYHASLEPPVFDLGARWVELQTAIYTHLGRFKLRLADIKVEGATSNPGDVSVACWILNYGAVVRYRLDRVEAWSNSPRLAEDTALTGEIVNEAMQVLRIASPNAKIVMHSVNVALHGIVAEETAARVASYVTRTPDGSPSLIPSGVSFLCEFPSGEGQGSIVLERSALIPGGMFLRITSEHAGFVSETEAMNRSIEFFQSSAGRLGLDIIWGS